MKQKSISVVERQGNNFTWRGLNTGYETTWESNLKQGNFKKIFPIFITINK